MSGQIDARTGRILASNKNEHENARHDHNGADQNESRAATDKQLHLVHDQSAEDRSHYSRRNNYPAYHDARPRIGNLVDMLRV